mmetsp:Transcript_31339/g.89912  ORF Transcript_31339/g.89912 Transcript_31339/m.89912 type:complete len:156 (-) Transcript_31339:85-552(-)
MLGYAPAELRFFARDGRHMHKLKVETGRPPEGPVDKHGTELWPQGGYGMLFSAGLAEELALRHGDRWIQHQAWAIANDCMHVTDGKWDGCTWVYYDYQMAWVLSWVPGAAVEFMDQVFNATCHASYLLKPEPEECPEDVLPAVQPFLNFVQSGRN